jgi:hypothetical protein
MRCLDDILLVTVCDGVVYVHCGLVCGVSLLLSGLFRPPLFIDSTLAFGATLLLMRILGVKISQY